MQIWFEYWVVKALLFSSRFDLKCLSWELIKSCFGSSKIPIGWTQPADRPLIADIVTSPCTEVHSANRFVSYIRCSFCKYRGSLFIAWLYYKVQGPSCPRQRIVCHPWFVGYWQNSKPQPSMQPIGTQNSYRTQEPMYCHIIWCFHFNSFWKKN